MMLAEPILVTLVALVVYFWNGMNVGRARVRLGVPAPRMDGPDEFQRIMRVHMNMLEQMVLFLPLFWLAVYSGAPRIATVLGVLWIVGRILYARGYVRSADKRHLGFVVSFIASAGLFLLTLVNLFYNAV